MKATQELHDLGQSLWLDNITRDIIDDGTLRRYIDAFSITGLTSNPTIFDQAIRNGTAYDDDIRKKARAGRSGEALFLELALDDLRRAADLFLPVHKASGGIDGWVSLEVSPLLAYDAERTIDEAVRLHTLARRPNIFIKIPGTEPGLLAIEEATLRGVPVNVTLLFSRDQYVAAAEAYLRGIERRLARDLDPNVPSVGSIFVSRWDKAVMDKVPKDLRNRLGIAIAQKAYKAYCAMVRAPRWQSLVRSGGRMQRLLWASTGSKDPTAPDTLYVEALAAPNTIDTMPDKTIAALADHGKIGGVMASDGGDSEKTIAEFARLGVDEASLAGQLQREGAAAFEKSWNDLLACVAEKSKALHWA